ncbi:hypothetical protein G7Y89_g11042 [Cudoniella acicularis]|uniref:Uncharacterized protein n=1 Tax=Cudoniella acicularis TaxID=354080 RepID=A0A8H4VYM8_9HELO|nr:hypothetical protein G7Y89_g11042 [Cudoniella acicularis]
MFDGKEAQVAIVDTRKQLELYPVADRSSQSNLGLYYLIYDVAPSISHKRALIINTNPKSVILPPVIVIFSLNDFKTIAFRKHDETMANLANIQHLVQYTFRAYDDGDGAEFRSSAKELKGKPIGARKVESTRSAGNHVHLGVRNSDTLVLAFRGTDFPMTWTHV